MRSAAGQPTGLYVILEATTTRPTRVGQTSGERWGQRRGEVDRGSYVASIRRGVAVSTASPFARGQSGCARRVRSGRGSRASPDVVVGPGHLVPTRRLGLPRRAYRRQRR